MMPAPPPSLPAGEATRRTALGMALAGVSLPIFFTAGQGTT